MQAWQLIKEGVVAAFAQMLGRKDPALAIGVLEALDRLHLLGERSAGEDERNPIAEEFCQVGGMARLEELQMPDNTLLYKAVIRLLEGYYEDSIADKRRAEEQNGEKVRSESDAGNE